jgi:hypothetical protein
MRHAAAVLTVFIAIWIPSRAVATEAAAAPAISARIHDYASLPVDLVRRAQQRASEVYGSIGVTLQWLHPIRPLELLAEPLDPAAATAQAGRELLIVILTADMARRHPIGPDVVGLAAATLGGRGRVAYVVSERVAQISNQAECHAMDVMGLVVAHEIAHLLLPFGSHSAVGLMRPRWRIEDFRQEHTQFDFTGWQAAFIRDALKPASAPTP